MNNSETQRHLTPFETALFGVPINRLPTLLPGGLTVLIIALASHSLSDYLGSQLLGFEKSPISPILIAIVFGFIFAGIFNLPMMLVPGVTFSIKKILRLGIILLGIRLTIFDVFRLGAFGVPIVAVCILGSLIITTWINNKLELPERLGILIAIGTSICGVTAIVAASPAIEAEEEESAYAIAVITIFGLFATLFYPYLANFILAGQANQVGLFLGTSVHETAQVVGAGQIYADVFSQPLALDIATITKLVRNVFMAAVIPIMALNYARRNEDSARTGADVSFAKLFPRFILGFLTMALIRSLGDAGINAGGQAFGLLPGPAWSDVIASIKGWAELCLVIALAGVGLSTNFRSLRELGIKPLFVGLAASSAVGVIGFIAIKVIGNLVVF